jgi:hypothetical protein
MMIELEIQARRLPLRKDDVHSGVVVGFGLAEHHIREVVSIGQGERK